MYSLHSVYVYCNVCSLLTDHPKSATQKAIEHKVFSLVTPRQPADTDTEEEEEEEEEEEDGELTLSCIVISFNLQPVEYVAVLPVVVLVLISSLLSMLLYCLWLY